jgi:hypothetical protein
LLCYMLQRARPLGATSPLRTSGYGVRRRRGTLVAAATRPVLRYKQRAAVIAAHRWPSPSPSVRRFTSSAAAANQGRGQGLGGLGAVVGSDYKQLVHRQRKLLSQMQLQLSELGAESDDQELLGATKLHLDELFLLCMVGEFNSGKSSVVNALLGGRHVREGVTPTTDRVCLLKHTDDAATSAVAADVSNRGHRAHSAAAAAAAAFFRYRRRRRRLSLPPPFAAAAAALPARGEAYTSPRAPTLHCACACGLCAVCEAAAPTVLELPVPWLRDVTLIDTPGTNAIVAG